jgi:hypothetical protein
MPSSILKVTNERKSSQWGNAIESINLRIKYYQIAAIPLILLVILEWILTIVQKKGYYNSLDTISATFMGLKCEYLSFVKNRILESYYFLQFHGAFQENGGPIFFVLLL